MRNSGKRPAPPAPSSAAWLHPLVVFEEFQDELLPIGSEWPTRAEAVELLDQGPVPMRSRALMAAGKARR